jgi:tetratricopeptide (TPR) repeat protein
MKQNEGIMLKRRAIYNLSVIFIGAALITLIGVSKSFACAWDSNTIRDELQSRDTALFHLITGQFPQHGTAFYEQQARQAKEALALDSNDEQKVITALNELGVAYTKLGQYQEALDQFHRIEKLSPGRYETLSNIGVLYKKMGDYEKAAAFIQRALKIKPEGHMGLGDWYLKMLSYQAAIKRSGRAPERNFLGDIYATWKLNRKQYKGRFLMRSYLEALIRNDRHFPGTYLVLGDYLVERDQKNLALWAYVRALNLGHKNPEAIKIRLQSVLSYWETSVIYTQSLTKYVETYQQTVTEISRDLAARQAWTKSFQALEAELIKAAGDTKTVDFNAVKARMKAANVLAIASPEEHGLRSGITLTIVTRDLFQRLGALALLGLILIFFAVKRGCALKNKNSKRDKALV